MDAQGLALGFGIAAKLVYSMFSTVSNYLQ